MSRKHCCRWWWRRASVVTFNFFPSSLHSRPHLLSSCLSFRIFLLTFVCVHFTGKRCMAVCRTKRLVAFASDITTLSSPPRMNAKHRQMHLQQLIGTLCLNGRDQECNLTLKGRLSVVEPLYVYRYQTTISPKRKKSGEKDGGESSVCVRHTSSGSNILSRPAMLPPQTEAHAPCVCV